MVLFLYHIQCTFFFFSTNLVWDVPVHTSKQERENFKRHHFLSRISEKGMCAGVQNNWEYVYMMSFGGVHVVCCGFTSACIFVFIPSDTCDSMIVLFPLIWFSFKSTLHTCMHLFCCCISPDTKPTSSKAYSKDPTGSNSSWARSLSLSNSRNTKSFSSDAIYREIQVQWYWQCFSRHLPARFKHLFSLKLFQQRLSHKT